MVAAMRQNLDQLMPSSGSHKDLTASVVRPWEKVFSYLEQNN